MDQMEEMLSRLAKNSDRIAVIETELTFISTVVRTADGFIKGLKSALTWSTLLCASFISLFVWVLSEKNGEFKEMQKSIVSHSIQINETLIILKSNIEKNDKRHNEIDLVTGSSHGHNK